MFRLASSWSLIGTQRNPYEEVVELEVKPNVFAGRKVGGLSEVLDFNSNPRLNVDRQGKLRDAQLVSLAIVPDGN
jgi:hypothetical protein